MLCDGIFIATCLATLEKEIHCELQKICYTLQHQAATCNGLKTIHGIAAKRRKEFHLCAIVVSQNQNAGSFYSPWSNVGTEQILSESQSLIFRGTIDISINSTRFQGERSRVLSEGPV